MAQRWSDPTKNVPVTEAEIVFVAVDKDGRPTPIKD